MAKNVVVQLVDDLDGSEATESVQFGLDGTDYEIDLNEKNAAALRKALEKYTAAGRRASSARSSGRSGARKSASTYDAKAIRVWADENNIKLSARGRIPSEIVEQYKSAGGQ
jgi:hypothetical protein